MIRFCLLAAAVLVGCAGEPPTMHPEARPYFHHLETQKVGKTPKVRPVVACEELDASDFVLRHARVRFPRFELDDRGLVCGRFAFQADAFQMFAPLLYKLLPGRDEISVRAVVVGEVVLDITGSSSGIAPDEDGVFLVYPAARRPLVEPSSVRLERAYFTSRVMGRFDSATIILECEDGRVDPGCLELLPGRHRGLPVFE